MKTVARTPLPDPITEAEVSINLTWSADERTRQAIERQAKVLGFKTPDEYLKQGLAAMIGGHEEDTYVGPDGQLVSGWDIDRP
jgi:hypothetical protein